MTQAWPAGSALSPAVAILRCAVCTRSRARPQSTFRGVSHPAGNRAHPSASCAFNGHSGAGATSRKPCPVRDRTYACILLQIAPALRPARVSRAATASGSGSSAAPSFDGAHIQADVTRDSPRGRSTRARFPPGVQRRVDRPAGPARLLRRAVSAPLFGNRTAQNRGLVQPYAAENRAGAASGIRSRRVTPARGSSKMMAAGGSRCDRS